MNNPEKIRASASVRGKISVRCRSARLRHRLTAGNAYPVDKEVRKPGATIVFGAGAHVCNHLQSKTRPLIADWPVKTLK